MTSSWFFILQIVFTLSATTIVYRYTQRNGEINNYDEFHNRPLQQTAHVFRVVLLLLFPSILLFELVSVKIRLLISD